MTPRAESPALLEIEGAAFGYGERRVLSEVSLRLERGRMVGVAGPNGSGKSTLVRGVLGLLQAQEGRVTRNTQRLGYVPQRDTLDALFPITALEVVNTGAYGRLHGFRMLCPEDRRLARLALERVGLSSRAQRLFSQLSGGQRQRILLARALVMRPELLVLDEPTSGVDTEAEAAILELLEELRDEGLSVLLVSHRMVALRESLDELLWVDEGMVRHEDPRVFLDPARPGTLFAARRGAGAG